MTKRRAHARIQEARRGTGGRSRATVRLLAVLLFALVVIAGVWALRPQEGRTPSTDAPAPSTQVSSIASEVSDAELQRAADDLLASANPSLPENEHFTRFARQELSWMVRQHAVGRLTVAFVSETMSAGLSSSVFMAATLMDGRPTIMIAKPRFHAFLRDGGRLTAPFTPRQRNDFVIALVHEVYHLQNWRDDPEDDEERSLIETQAWHAVNLGVVRPWRSSNQPVDPRFLQVDDGFRSCADRLPCRAVERLVRVRR